MPAASRSFAVAAALVLGPVVAAGPARADSLHIDVQSNPERNFTPVQELSYEAIVAGVDGYKVDLRLRVALHNASKRRQDAVLSLALPRDAELVGLAVARDGTWSPGRAAAVAVEPAHRASGTVFARALAPAVAGDLPAAEVVVFNLDPETTIQIELQLKVPPRLRADRWELELPGRGDDRWGLAPERRVVVQGARPGDAPRFWLDDRASDGAAFLLSRPEDRSVVSWPYKHVSKDRSILDGHLELLPDPTPPGVTARSGRFRAYLRLGAAPPPRPDHVVVVLDRSRSTAPDLHRDAFAALTGLFDELPAQLTFDAISFARTARPLLEGDEFPSVRDRGARDRVAAALDAGAREQGTDLAAALALAGRRIAARGARRPLVVVITDGMLPAGIGAQQIGHVFSDSLTKSTRPELLFIVDEPMMLRGGITPQHPIAGVATALGARISLESLAQHARRTGGEPPEGLTEALLAAPAVLSDLELQLPRRATLDEPAPGGLVAGNVLVVRGSYTGAPPTIGVRGKLAGVRTSRTLRAVASRPPPAALVASFGLSDLDRAAADGFTRPPWFNLNQQRVARLGITWAGRGNGDERGFLDEKIFRNYLGIRVFPRARACFNKALARDQQLGGKVVFEIEVGKGEVMLAKVDTAGLNHREPGFEACLLEAAWALEIPAGRLDDQIYRLRYPVVFNPPAGGRPAMEDDPLGPGTVELLLGLPNR
ncbi:hypothetical protein SAMN02745121_03461 [Nannocystis exedens]|uniref:VWFA domain-containing protein n=1 Tax=Nannocystis exedens TaxID=54 RepID=A0A1I1YR06_9BACT|nr:hypothetical protein [Nannocystis exedens]PCC70218.1 hypothetical protein NAEX_03251 [Nannocystis exedens]SFE21752.1 hypothetical protein SAMN02745121_03461 [Nannocystis exedens]